MEFARAAIGGGYGRSATRAAGQTAIDAITIRVVGNDEHLSFCLSGSCAQKGRPKNKNRKKHSHKMLMDRRIAANDKNAAKIVKASLTEPDGGLVTLRCFTVPMVDDAPGLFSLLTGPSHLLHSLHMNGLNHICGIRPEIIS